MPRPQHAWLVKLCAVHRGIKKLKRLLVWNRFGEGLTGSILSPSLPSLFSVKEARKQCPNSSEPSENIRGFVLGGQRYRPGLTTVETPNEPVVSGVRMCVPPHYHRVRQMEPCHRLGEVSRHSSWAFELCLNKNNPNIEKKHAVCLLTQRAFKRVQKSSSKTRLACHNHPWPPCLENARVCLNLINHAVLNGRVL